MLREPTTETLERSPRTALPSLPEKHHNPKGKIIMMFKTAAACNFGTGCVEVGAPAFKATASQGISNCVEVEMPTEDMIIVRDSKEAHLPDGERTELRYTPDEWLAFIDGAKNDEFDLAPEPVNA